MLHPERARFWRGVREPWLLLARMRRHPALWVRYWRIVSVQAVAALLAGFLVFWVGKQGAEAWRDAFGSDEAPEVAAPRTADTQRASGSSAPAPASAAAPEATPSTSPPASGPAAPGTPGRSGGRRTGEPKEPAGRSASPSSSSRAAPVTPGEPGAPRTSAPAEPEGGSTSAAAEPSRAAPGATSSEKVGAARPPDRQDDDDADEDEKDDEEEADDDGAPAGLQARIEALKKAPPEERGARTAELVAAALAKAQAEARRAERAGKGKGDGSDKADLAEERQDLKDEIGQLASASEVLAREPPDGSGEARKARKRLERRLDALQKEASRLEKRGAPPLSDAERAQLDRARTALRTVRRHERGLAGRFGALVALIAALYASLGIAQTAILALSRDFHDVLSRELSLLVHVAPEDPPMRPRIRLDLPWVRRKANRRAQFFLGFLPGQLLISAMGALFPIKHLVVTALTTVWAAYWWTVMTAGQSARAWTPPESTPRPWYLRGWFWLTDRVFFFRWGVPRAWGRIWERFARRFYGPSERVEEQPLEFAGLALSRAVLLIPGLKLLFRPLFPVCAAHLLVEHAAQARLPVPVTAAEVADAAAHAPDAEARAHSGAVAG